MRCQRARKWMTAAVDGELSPRRRRALDGHLAACAACRRELAVTERMLTALEGLPMPAFALATAAVLVLAIGIVRRTGEVPGAPAVRPAPKVDARDAAQALR